MTDFYRIGSEDSPWRTAAAQAKKIFPLAPEDKPLVRFTAKIRFTKTCWLCDHACKNPKCVNPKHLEPVSLSENSTRGNRHKRRTACKRGHALTPENTIVVVVERRKCRACHERNAQRRSNFQ